MIDQEEMEENFRGIVQDAIRSQDFSDLNVMVVKSINAIMEEISNDIQDIPLYSEKEFEKQNESWKTKKNISVQEIYKFNENIRIKGYIMLICGSVLALGFGMGSISSTVSLFFGGDRWFDLFIMYSGFVISLISCVLGKQDIQIMNNFQKYMNVIGLREYCEINELVKNTGKSYNYVICDLKKMIKKGLFKQGHLDDEGHYLILTQRSFECYRNEVNHFSEETKSVLSFEVEKLLTEGKEYIRKFQIYRNRTSNEEVTSKIFHMELVVEKIFQCAKDNPKVIYKLKKLMKYYLPTTLKLLDAYIDLDEQPINSENIDTSKKEIIHTLETLNIAFEKILDSIFRDKVWDVSTDISVLNTVLEQDGLTRE